MRDPSSAEGNGLDGGTAATTAVVPSSVVDLDRLAAWMDREGLPSGPITGTYLITGGTQNVLLHFERGGRSYVLRRPPEHKRTNSDETMRREARVLGALVGTPVPHPALIAVCPGEEVLGASFYLMEPIDGFNPVVALPEAFRDDLVRHLEMGLAMADAIAALGNVDLREVGLSDFGRPEQWLERQVARWSSQLETYAEFDGYPGSVLPGVESVASWLDRGLPATWSPGLIHGDFHFGNVLFGHDSTSIVAIVDWELATVGDPLLDLGHLLAQWPRAGADSVTVVLDLPGLPGRREMIERYGASSARDLDAITWYQVLACFRMGIILEGTYARACAGLAPLPTGDRLHRKAIALFEQAHELIGAS